MSLRGTGSTLLVIAAAPTAMAAVITSGTTVDNLNSTFYWLSNSTQGTVTLASNGALNLDPLNASSTSLAFNPKTSFGGEELVQDAGR